MYNSHSYFFDLGKNCNNSAYKKFSLDELRGSLEIAPFGMKSHCWLRFFYQWRKSIVRELFKSVHKTVHMQTESFTYCERQPITLG